MALFGSPAECSAAACSAAAQAGESSYCNHLHTAHSTVSFALLSCCAWQVNVFFSAHGVPKSYVEEAGDPYKEEMEECIDLIMAEMRKRGRMNEHTLAYQSRVGPVEWLQPYTDDSIRWVELRLFSAGLACFVALRWLVSGLPAGYVNKTDCGHKSSRWWEQFIVE